MEGDELWVVGRLGPCCSTGRCSEASSGRLVPVQDVPRACQSFAQYSDPRHLSLKSALCRWFQFAGSHADGLSKLRSVKVEFSHV